jgi:hypothetical protein
MLAPYCTVIWCQHMKQTGTRYESYLTGAAGTGAAGATGAGTVGAVAVGAVVGAVTGAVMGAVVGALEGAEIAPEFGAGTAGATAGGTDSDVAGTDAPGVELGTVAGGTADEPAAGAVAGGLPNSSTTLLEVPGARELAMAAKPKVQIKNEAASPAVKRLSTLAEPDAPNKVPDAPLPNAAPISAPLPC